MKGEGFEPSNEFRPDLKPGAFDRLSHPCVNRSGRLESFNDTLFQVVIFGNISRHDYGLSSEKVLILGKAIPLIEGVLREQLMQNRLTVGWAGRNGEQDADR